MKRKIFTLCLTAMFALVAYGQQPSGEIMKASVAPVIDGVVDEVWAEANVYDIDKPFASEVPTLGEPGETNWRALWTDDGMFILLTVTDDAFYPNYVAGGANNYEYDKPEIYFDVNYILQDAAGPAAAGSGHYQVAPGFTDGQNDGTAITEDNGVIYAFMVTEPNYIGEYFVPFSLLKDKDGIGVDKTGNIGFDVTIIDRDPGDEARRRAVWANIGPVNESWSNMDDAGIIILDGAEAGTYVESITLTGGSITEDNGTLQIVAEILPEDASNKVLLWSVENVTGKASISSTGLLTAIADGEVIVTASATDGSYEEASVTVTITGQVTTVWKINVIKNGTFDLVETNGTATFWGGWTDASPAHTVVDAVSVHSPVVSADDPQVWRYQFNQQNLTADPYIEYTFAFKAWAGETRTFTVDFEDIELNGYRRYGSTTDSRSADGRSEWTFDITTEPTWYVFDVVFDEIRIGLGRWQPMQMPYFLKAI